MAIVNLKWCPICDGTVLHTTASGKSYNVPNNGNPKGMVTAEYFKCRCGTVSPILVISLFE